MELSITKVGDALRIDTGDVVNYYNPNIFKISANINDEFTIIDINNNKPLGRYNYVDVIDKFGTTSLEEYLDLLYSSHIISMQTKMEIDNSIQYSSNEFFTNRKHIDGRKIFGKTFVSRGKGSEKVLPSGGLEFDIKDILISIDEIVGYEGKFLAWIDKINSTHPIDIIMSWETPMPVNMQVITGQYRPDLGVLLFKKVNSPVIDGSGISNFYFTLYFIKNI